MCDGTQSILLISYIQAGKQTLVCRFPTTHQALHFVIKYISNLITAGEQKTPTQMSENTIKPNVLIKM